MPFTCPEVFVPPEAIMPIAANLSEGRRPRKPSTCPKAADLSEGRRAVYLFGGHWAVYLSGGRRASGGGYHAANLSEDSCR